MQELRRIRKERGLSQDELAERAGVAQSTVALAEVGKHTPRVETLVKLANALEVEVGDLAPEQYGKQKQDPGQEWAVRGILEGFKADKLSAEETIQALRDAGIFQERRRTTVSPTPDRGQPESQGEAVDKSVNDVPSLGMRPENRNPGRDARIG